MILHSSFGKIFGLSYVAIEEAAQLKGVGINTLRIWEEKNYQLPLLYFYFHIKNK